MSLAWGFCVDSCVCFFLFSLALSIALFCLAHFSFSFRSLLVLFTLPDLFHSFFLSLKCGVEGFDLRTFLSFEFLTFKMPTGVCSDISSKKGGNVRHVMIFEK